jgi:S-methyl-5-thioribulose 1-phosphate isomerase
VTDNHAQDRFQVHYRIQTRDGRDIEAHAQDIALEQTVEVPYEVVPKSHFTAGLVGRIEKVTAVAGQTDSWDVSISFRCDLTAFSVPQFLNVLFGNISLKNHILITGLDLSDSLLNAFGGPSFGIAGIRRQLGVYGRPLACTAIKPMGLPVADLAKIAGEFATGGADLIKDDHGLADQPFHPFTERVARCQDAISRANAKTGGNSLYFPMLVSGFDTLEAQVRHAVREGIKGLLIGPLLVGCDVMRHLAREYNLILMAHPALTGTFFHDRHHGITPAVLLGTLFRLFGADISIFPNAGGRFHFSHQECLDLADRLRTPLGSLPAAFPCPAGGMNLQRLPELGASYGQDSVFLIGGDVLRQADVTAATGRFMDGIRKTFDEHLFPPVQPPVSACEWRPAMPENARLQDLLTCRDYQWQGRAVQAYKPGEEALFKGITRQELTGRFGEETAFDLRYFEIAPGGHSSLEKHLHEHVIIGVRGAGMLVKPSGEYPINQHDIAYVHPLEGHQLQNRGDQPFGFFCIVDHHRDTPQPI